MVGYALLKHKSKSISKYVLAVPNRILRIAPAYYLIYLVYYGLTLQVRSGEFFNFYTSGMETCSNYQYTLLFTDNVLNPNDMCMNWCWYLHTDLQLFIFCMVLLAIYSKSRRCGFIAIYACLVANVAYVGYKTY